MASNSVRRLKQTPQLLNRIARLEGQVKALRPIAKRSNDWHKLLLLASSIEGAVDGVIIDVFERYLDSKGKMNKKKTKELRQALKIVLKKV